MQVQLVPSCFPGMGEASMGVEVGGRVIENLGVYV